MTVLAITSVFVHGLDAHILYHAQTNVLVRKDALRCAAWTRVRKGLGVGGVGNQLMFVHVCVKTTNKCQPNTVSWVRNAETHVGAPPTTTT